MQTILRLAHMLLMGTCLLSTVLWLARTTNQTPVAQAAGTWYVATTGNNANDCRSPATACRTVQAAINKANSDDKISIAAGTYVENININNTFANFRKSMSRHYM